MATIMMRAIKIWTMVYWASSRISFRANPIWASYTNSNSRTLMLKITSKTWTSLHRIKINISSSLTGMVVVPDNHHQVIQTITSTIKWVKWATNSLMRDLAATGIPRAHHQTSIWEMYLEDTGPASKITTVALGRNNWITMITSNSRDTTRINNILRDLNGSNSLHSMPLL